MSEDYAPHLTAIDRTKPSAPARMLRKLWRLKGWCLDYGCGHGMDAYTYGMDRYDPHWYPTRPTRQYDTITCTYVLNVVKPEDIPNILQDIRSLLAPGGTAYLTVRRDLGASAAKGRGTTQRDVHLDLPTLPLSSTRYCTYVLKAIDNGI
jgi:ATP adenylyltransferase